MSQHERYEKGGLGRWYWDYRDRAALSFIGEGPMLDVGCGEMITTRKIPGAFGIDLDRGDVRGSVYDLPFKTDTFGTVLLLEVIEHLKRPWRALQEIHRVLKPGGKIIVLFPNDRTFKVAWFLFGMWGEIGRNRGHIWQWKPLTVWAGLYLSRFNNFKTRSIPFRFWPLSLHHIIVGEKC